MAVLALWAGASNSTPSNWTVNNNKLPSPVSVDMTREQIWDSKAGRNAKGKMIATYVAQKYTWNITWGVLTESEFSKIGSLLTNGFFKFNQGTPTSPPSSAGTYYRSEITYSNLQVGTTRYYKDVSVSVIQQ